MEPPYGHQQHQVLLGTPFGLSVKRRKGAPFIRLRASLASGPSPGPFAAPTQQCAVANRETLLRRPVRHTASRNPMAQCEKPVWDTF